MPCVKSLGFDFSCESLMFFGARKDTPANVVALIQKALEEALSNPECIERLEAAGALNIKILGQEELYQWAEEETARMREYGPKIGLTLVK